MTGKETYYAIRMGDPRRHVTYFKLRDGEWLPELFATKEAAEVARKAMNSTCTKVQRVKIKAA